MMAFLYYIRNNIDWEDKGEVIGGIYDFHVGVEYPNQIRAAALEKILASHPTFKEEGWYFSPNLVDRVPGSNDAYYHVQLEEIKRANLMKRKISQKLWSVKNDFTCLEIRGKSKLEVGSYMHDTHVVAPRPDDVVALARKVILQKYSSFTDNEWDVSFKEVVIVNGLKGKIYTVILNEINV